MDVQIAYVHGCQPPVVIIGINHYKEVYNILGKYARAGGQEKQLTPPSKYAKL